MAALAYLTLCVGQEIFRVGRVFLNSGFSIKKCIEYVKKERHEYLFNRYLHESQMEMGEDFLLVSGHQDIVEDGASLQVRQENSSEAYEYFKDFDDIEIVEGVELGRSSTFYDAIDPNLVYSNNILGKLEEGVSFTISGNILFHCERFSINLVVENTHRDIALHINPRLPQNYIVRNCRVKKLWGQEEVTSALPFILRRGSVFRIQILITNTEYLISVNGNHFAAFEHRLPYTNVTCLEVKGDVDNVTMERTEVSSYPQRTSETEPNVIKQVVRTEEPLRVRKSSFFERDHSSTTEELPLPFYGSFDNSFTNGSTLVVHGQVKLLPHSFYINLQKGKDIWPHPLIAFHFNPRFSNFGGKHVICRNSWIKDKWDKEERSEMKTEFLPGNTFSMSISCTYTAYEVYLNNIFIAEFKFRTDPTMVDTVYIQGDIKLRSITVDNQHNKQQNVD